MSEFRSIVEDEVAKLHNRFAGGRPMSEAEEIQPNEIPKELRDLMKPFGKIAMAWYGIHGYILDVESDGMARINAVDLKKLAASKHFRWISPASDGRGWNFGLEHDKPAGEWAR